MAKKIFSTGGDLPKVTGVDVVKSSGGMARLSREWRRHGGKIGLVPTMGALHAGHMALVERARKECHHVVVSIYVNPSQFGPKEDLARYPRPRRRDLALCRAAGVEAVLAPKDLYGAAHSTWVEETEASRGQEGAQRPGHFRGVATVVLMLLNVVLPDRVYFGQKDAQQVRVVQRMVADLYVPVKVVVVPTLRDRDGVALSSRNRYLSKAERVVAAQFAELLREAAEDREDDGQPEVWLGEQLQRVEGLLVDYCERREGWLIVAVRVGKTRLLDNRRIMAH